MCTLQLHYRSFEPKWLMERSLFFNERGSHTGCPSPLPSSPLSTKRPQNCKQVLLPSKFRRTLQITCWLLSVLVHFLLLTKNKHLQTQIVYCTAGHSTKPNTNVRMKVGGWYSTKMRAKKQMMLGDFRCGWWLLVRSGGGRVADVFFLVK